MYAPQNELFLFFEKFIKRGKVTFPKQGGIVIEDKLENLLLLIEALEEKGIPVRDNLGSFYLKKGSVLAKTVKLRISGKTAQISPRES
ncbi:MAG TPA: hypothetical protein VMV66_03035 [Candidatus Humimicrobiaceae bacterium]|nr:hypothetical protein [Candidatus Humimicrobiaceae bacterium]